MKRVFADSFYFFALGNVRDPAHSRAVEFSRTFVGEIVTSDWILFELGDGLVLPTQRPLFVRLVDQLRADPFVRIVECCREWMDAGLELFRERGDKAWTLTDCISFQIMTDKALSDALTGDHHFEQAGFNALLK